MEKANRILAIIYSLGLGITETILGWGSTSTSFFWIADYIIYAWLLIGAFTKGTVKSATLLVGGWAFATAIIFNSLLDIISPTVYHLSGESLPIKEISLFVIFIATHIIGLFLSYKTINVK